MNSLTQHLAKGNMNNILLYINPGLFIGIHITKETSNIAMRCMQACSVSKSCPTLYDLMGCSLNIAHQASLFMGFLRQEYWSSFSKGIFPTQGSNPSLLCLLHWQVGSLTTVPPDVSL